MMKRMLIATTLMLIAGVLQLETWSAHADSAGAAYDEQTVLASPAVGKFIHFTETPTASTFSPKEPFTAAYYFYWYDEESGAHFKNIDGSDALTTHPAESKGYTWKSVDWHRRQLKDMMEAGIDVVLPVYWGSPANSKLPGNWSDGGLPKLVEAQQSLIAQGLKPPKIGMFYDTSTLRINVTNKRVNLATGDGKAWFYVTIRNFFSQVPPELWATISGKPVIFLYTSGYESAGSDNPKLLEYVREHFKRDFGTAAPYILAERSWRFTADSTYAWGGALGLRVYGVASLGPGYDDSATIRKNYLTKDRLNGDFYRDNWQRLLAMDPVERPKMVVIETWNEFHEGTNIADSKEHGRKYLEMTSKYTKLWREGKRWTFEGEYAGKKLVSADFGKKHLTKGLLLKTGGDGQAVFLTSKGKEAAQTAPGSKYLYFDIDNSFFFDSKRPVEIEVEYLDNGRQAFTLQYDSLDKNAPLAGVYKSAVASVKRNTQQWKTASFKLDDAMFADRQNYSADFRLVANSSSFTVRSVSVLQR